MNLKQQNQLSYAAFIGLDKSDQKINVSLQPGKNSKIERSVIKSGAEALLGLIGLFPLGHPISKLITLAPGGKRMVTSVYSIFSKLHDADSCKLNYEKGN